MGTHRIGGRDSFWDALESTTKQLLDVFQRYDMNGWMRGKVDGQQGGFCFLKVLVSGGKGGA